MTPEIAMCLSILGVAVVVFAWDRFPADVVALGVMLAVIATGLVPADKAFAGFGSDTVIMILGLFIMAAGLIQTGVVEAVGHRVFAIAGSNSAIFLPVIMVTAAGLSSILSNAASTAFFVPLVIAYALKINESPSKMLLPLAFATTLSSSVTLIATSTNLLVSDLLTRSGQPPLGIFELTPIGLPIAIVGIVYVWLIGVRLIPERKNQKSEQKVGERRYQADVIVEAEGRLVGKTLKDAKLTRDAGLRVAKLVRGGETLRGAKRLAEYELQADDELLLEGERADLLKIKDMEGLSFKSDVDDMPLVDLENEEVDQEEEELKIVEGVLLPRSPLIGQSLRSLAFKERYGLRVLALHRRGRVPQSISAARLRMGDVLLLQGTAENVKALESGNLFNIFGGVEDDRLNRSRALLASAIFVLAILAATMDLVKLPVAVMGGAFLMFLTRCLTPEEAYRHVEWKALILIGSLFSLGAAMETSGAGRFLAQELLSIVGRESPFLLLSVFFALTVALTQPMSNQAAALVVIPIALATAEQIGVDPRPFAMIVAIAASCSFLTPLEPACIMVYGPGKYKFSDFLIVGAPLVVIVYAIAITGVVWLWPI